MSAGRDGYRVLEHRSDLDVDRDFPVDVLVGLSASPKHLSSRYFYDAEGSRYFQQITDLEEYYPTRAEHEILEARREAICAAAIAGGRFNLVDLGAGDGRKTKVLLEHINGSGARCRYVPIDVSESAIQSLAADVRAAFPNVEVAGLVSEYLDGLDWLAQQSDRPNLVLFLGSNVGNFNRSESRDFLRRLWNALQPDDRLLIGFDLKKDVDVLLEAYNDAQGVTAAFNLNLLARINRELGGTFDLARFAHFATYNVHIGAMEMYLLSLEHQTVRVEALQRSFAFKPWEPIHTEFSFKYLDEDVQEMADETGFVLEERFWDAEQRFCDALWRVEKGRTR